MFRALKVAQIVLAALIPVLAAADATGWVLGALGALVVVLEGLQQLFQFQQNWTSYRSTCEALKHQKYLYLAHAGPYSMAKHPDALLAEHVEALVSQEHAKWAAAQEDLRAHAGTGS
jgi:protein-S-isoprenylcysteine O-methyltransferase Ste14